ncbi:MAG: 4'-phosphopantetheinyl transferase [Saprospiraceae bacterium]|jgi:4'-phosphopantetheinyl transferase|tara:strand:+ start:41 stop:682 length:642 start_codon:yes stop_codon:yes gene_type:complete
MPIELKISNDPEIELSIWRVTEPESYFESKLDIHGPEEEIIEKLSARKKLEWLASRYLLHLMSGRALRGEFDKDEHGKPHLKDSDYHVSISHSNNHISVIASPHLVGIDIQKYVRNISRIRSKFVTEVEEKFIDESDPTRMLHIIWGAKESLYKAYGKRGLGFKKHIHVHSISGTNKQGAFKGKVLKGSYEKEFDLFYHFFDEYILVYAKESC